MNVSFLFLADCRHSLISVTRQYPLLADIRPLSTPLARLSPGMCDNTPVISRFTTGNRTHISAPKMPSFFWTEECAKQ